MPLNYGARWFSCAYLDSEGTDIILLARTPISMVGWIMVILMLNGAISYARLSQKPSSAQPEAQHIPRPGVPQCPAAFTVSAHALLEAANTDLYMSISRCDQHSSSA